MGAGPKPGENMKDFNVLGKAGSDKPLPDLVENVGQLERFVEFFVKMGWNVWPLPKGYEELMGRPLEVNKRLLYGERANKMRWHMILLGEIVEQFPDHFRTLGSAKISKQQQAMGAVTLTRALVVDDLLRFLGDRGYIKMAGRA